MITIDLFDPWDLRVQQIKIVVHNVAPLTSRILFEEELWKSVHRVTVALDKLEPIGLATLSPTDENGKRFRNYWYLGSSSLPPSTHCYKTCATMCTKVIETMEGQA